jgi:hypothetical protein
VVAAVAVPPNRPRASASNSRVLVFIRVPIEKICVGRPDQAPIITTS